MVNWRTAKIVGSAVGIALIAYGMFDWGFFHPEWTEPEAFWAHSHIWFAGAQLILLPVWMEEAYAAQPHDD